MICMNTEISHADLRRTLKLCVELCLACCNSCRFNWLWVWTNFVWMWIVAGRRFWHFSRLAGDCTTGPAGKLPERISDISESCAQMVLQLHNQVEVTLKFNLPERFTILEKTVMFILKLKNYYALEYTENLYPLSLVSLPPPFSLKLLPRFLTFSATKRT